MSIKDRIKFFENLNKNTQPQPLLNSPTDKTLHKRTDFKEPVAKLTSIQSQPRQITQNNSPQTDKKQTNFNGPSSQTLKSNDDISKPQKQQKNGKEDKKVQKDSSTQEPVSINVGNIRKMFETKNFPIVQQAPTYTKSCIGPTKKSQEQGQNTTGKDNQQHKVQQKRISLPSTIETDSEIKLTLKQRMKIAEMILAKTKAGSAIKHEHIEQPKTQQGENKKSQNIQGNSQHYDHGLKVELEQQIQKLDEQGRDSNQNILQDESDKLFKQALQQQGQKPVTLLTGQSNNLHLGTRKTVVRKRNNEDDFDDL